MGASGRPTIVHMVHSLDGGGTERFLVALLRAFDPHRFHHAVVTSRSAGSLASQLPDDVACYPLNWVGSSWLAGWTAGQTMRPLQPAVIHARNTGCWADAVVAGLLTPRANVVLGFHGLDRAITFDGRKRIIARWALRFGARFTTVSGAGRMKLHREADVPIQRIDVLPNGVDLGRFLPNDTEERQRIRHSFALPESAVVVGTVGSLTSVKNQRLLLDAFAQLAATMDNVRLLLVGDGPLRTVLTQQACDAGLANRVSFAGWRNDVPSLLSAMDVYVCSSAAEGMSNAVLEAMASGLAIIATDVGENSSMIRHGHHGFVVPPHSSKAIAQAVKTLGESPNLRSRLGAAARDRARAYDFHCAVQSYERYYRNLVDVRAKPRRTRNGRRNEGCTPIGACV